MCGAADAALCPPCAARLRPAPALPPPAGLDACSALLAYEGAGRELVARLKYRNNRAALPGLAAAMATLMPPLPQGGACTWVPTTPARRRERGFDHAELLARAVAARLGCRPLRLLRRLPGPPQTGQTRAARRLGPRFAVAHDVPAVVVLVDDVVTTGATLAAGAAVLRDGGAVHVSAVVAARTPAADRAQALREW